MSRKEEELVEQEMESLKNENLDKEQLLEEVISDTADDAGNTAKPELKAMSSDSEKAPEGKSQDMTEISGELTPEDAAVYNKDNDNEYEDSEPVEEDNYVIEEEPEEVVMVEVDGDDSDDVSDSASDRDSEDDTVVETFDPEFEETLRMDLRRMQSRRLCLMNRLNQKRLILIKPLNLLRSSRLTMRISRI